MGNYKEMKRRTRALKEVFSDEKFILSIIQSTEETNFRDIFSKVFSYYLCTADSKHNYSVDEIEKKFHKHTNEASGPIIDQRYYFQAYNGANERTYRKNGLDDISSLNEDIIQSMKILEDELGTTMHPTGGQIEGEIYSTFVTPDPKMIMRYALEYSPERLWYGPLYEGDRKKPIKTPIIIGEKKSDYIMRIIEKKIEGRTGEEKDRIRKAGKIVAEAYGSKRPRIAIIPEVRNCRFQSRFWY